MANAKIISYNSKELEDTFKPIFNKASKFCNSTNAYDDVWYWYVAEEVAKKILDKNLTIDKKCAEQVFEWKDLGVCDYDYNVWLSFEKHIGGITNG